LQIFNSLSQVKPVMMVKLVKDKMTNVSQGFCFVYFESPLVGGSLSFTLFCESHTIRCLHFQVAIEVLKMVVYYGQQIDGKVVTITYARYP